MDGLGLLAEAAQEEFDYQRSTPIRRSIPKSLYTSLGEAYLQIEESGAGGESVREGADAGEQRPVRAVGPGARLRGAGEKAKAEDAMARLAVCDARMRTRG